MAIIWIDIWNAQNSSKAKSLINWRFNIGRFITTIWGTNMNPGVSQCKNCWKWDHSAGVCRIQGAKCVRCNGTHQAIYHGEFAWCCKANDRINPPRLETKKSEHCPHSFRYSNYKGEHQANSTECPSSLQFSIRKDIIDHRDILLASFFNNGDIFWLMNIYSDASHSALKYLKDTEVNIWNLLIIAEDFNIRDSLWDLFFLHHLSISND